MKRIKVALRDLRPNPFRKKINGGKLDPEKVERLEESVGLDGFWDCLVGRERDGKIEIAFGHHRVAAATNVLGKDYETWISIDDLPRERMIRMMANENSASDGASEQDQIDMVGLARNWLKRHPESCKSFVTSETNEHSSRFGGLLMRPKITQGVPWKNWRHFTNEP